MYYVYIYTYIIYMCMYILCILHTFTHTHTHSLSLSLSLSLSDTQTYTQAVLAMWQKKTRMLGKLETLKMELETAFSSDQKAEEEVEAAAAAWAEEELEAAAAQAAGEGGLRGQADSQADALTVLENIIEWVNTCSKELDQAQMARTLMLRGIPTLTEEHIGVRKRYFAALEEMCNADDNSQVRV